MSKTVREIALAMGVPANDIIKEKQRIRDEIKRQQITVSKSGNKFVIADNDVKKIIEALQGKENEEDSNLNEEKEKLLDSAEKSSQLQDKVDKMETHLCGNVLHVNLSKNN